MRLPCVVSRNPKPKPETFSYLCAPIEDGQKDVKEK